MSYIVLARKWRPQTFDDLTGQEHVARTLTNAILSDRVPHAMLFTGARGVGKTTTARIIAMALNCKQGPTPSPCGKCDACVEIQRGQCVDVFEIDGASNRGINEIRELRDGVRYATSRDRYKIYIIDEVHMLTTEAFNALLKTLEEPPRHVVFLFATTEAHKIPVTILSRCQRFDFRRIPQHLIVARLEHIVKAENLPVPLEILSLIARQALGGMRDALSLLDQVIAFAGDDMDVSRVATILGVSERRRLFELSEALIEHDAARALVLVDDITQYGVDLPHFSAELVEHVRDLVVAASVSDPSRLTSFTETELITARAQIARTDVATLHRTFEILVTAAEDVSRSNHARVVLEMALVRIAALEPLVGLDAVLERLERIANGSQPLPPSGGTTPPASGGAPRSGPPPAAGGSSATPAAPSPVVSAAAPADAARQPERTGTPAPVASPRLPEVAATPTVPAAPVAPAAPAASTAHVMTPALWTTVVASIREEHGRVAAVLGRARLLDAPPLLVRISLPAFLRRQLDREAELLVLGAFAKATDGSDWTFDILVANDDAGDEAGYSIDHERALRQREREDEAKRFVNEHPATQRVMTTWPGARISRLRVDSLDEEQGT